MQEQLRSEAATINFLGDFVIDLRPEIEHCPICGRKLNVLKTDWKWFETLKYGKFRAKLRFLYCKDHRYLPPQENGKLRLRKYSASLPNHNRGKSPYMMEVLDYIGRSKFIRNQCRVAIEEELSERYGLEVSKGTISNLSIEYLIRFYLHHQLHFDKLVKEIKAGVGYILGMDGTGDGNSDRIVHFMDLLRGWVLKAVDVPSEGSKYIIPHLRDFVKRLGDPLVTLFDGSSGFEKAHKKVLRHVRYRFCTFHILKDIAIALFKDDYYALSGLLRNQPCTQSSLQRLRKELKLQSEEVGIAIKKCAESARAQSNLVGIPIVDMLFSQFYDCISWILRFREDNHGLRFPFALPRLNLYNRCVQGAAALQKLHRTYTTANKGLKVFQKLVSDLVSTVDGMDESSIAIRLLAKQLNGKLQHFHELRTILAIPDSVGDIPRDQLIVKKNEKILEMKHELAAYEAKLKHLSTTDEGARTICQYLDKYRSSLIMENITINKDGKEIMIELPRTTGALETSFGELKCAIRKRTGKKDTGHVLKVYNKYLGIFRNIQNASYISVMFGSEDNIVRALSEIPKSLIDDELHCFREQAIGYDITNRGHRSSPIGYEEILNGIEYVHEQVEKSMLLYQYHPPEAYGLESWGSYVIQSPDHFSSQLHC